MATPRTRAGGTSKVTAIGKEKIALNLDTLEREDKYDEFASVIGGRRIVFKDAAELDWQVLARARLPRGLHRGVHHRRGP